MAHFARRRDQADFGGQTRRHRHAALRLTAVEKAATPAEFRVDVIYVGPYVRR